ncbi:intracellular iron chaperone frataxin [Lysinibacillus alkalisoli]|uniref:Intracellular iron chaperone frataxin n=1 Tax=Lysinibacillus alkalisoli TaxID=1911548 RepID=A0A917LE75_9BACI|nr:DUF1801 domain-containing protein [Lysinibacillus alkalisoli]GGG15772.1 intracellular iron chaperone frataxin [Lysinibacillus alkalisoli]
MDVFKDVIYRIDEQDQRERLITVLQWVHDNFPSLTPVVKWNQAMFTQQETFIIGFSMAKKHMAVAPEAVAITHFSDAIIEAGYDHTKQLIRIPFTMPVDYVLLQKIIAWNCSEKQQCTTFWRAP